MTPPRLPSPILGIRAFGAVTNLGNSAGQTLASWVAQTRRQRRVNLEGFGDAFTLADRPDLAARRHGAGRLFALLESAVAEALEHQPCPDSASNSLNLLVLPQALDADEQQSLDARLTGLWPDREVTFTPIAGGSTAAWEALEIAYQALDADPGWQQVVIACVDSLCDPGRLFEAADANRLLRTNNREGYVPGEAAACVVLERLRDVTQLPPGQFALHRPALARQTDPWWPGTRQPDPQPLVSALSGALDRAGMNPTHISHLMSDADGSSWRAQIETRALGRRRFAETSARPHWRPATLFGQIGTAAGALSWTLASLMPAHRIEYANTILNWSLDPEGKSAACVLERSAKRV